MDDTGCAENRRLSRLRAAMSGLPWYVTSIHTVDTERPGARRAGGPGRRADWMRGR